MRPSRWIATVAITTAVVLTTPLTASAAATRATDPLAAYDHRTIAWHSCQLGPDDSEGLQLDQAGARAHGVYLFAGSACVDDPVNNYLDTGPLPATDTTCRIGICE